MAAALRSNNWPRDAIDIGRIIYYRCHIIMLLSNHEIAHTHTLTPTSTFSRAAHSKIRNIPRTHRIIIRTVLTQ